MLHAGRRAVLFSKPAAAAAGFSLVGENSHNISGGSGSNALTLPGPPAANDIVLVFHGTGGASFVGIGIETDQSYTFLVNKPAGANPGKEMAYKVMGATPDTEVNVTAHASVDSNCVIQVWRGVNTTTPIDNSISSDTSGTTGMPDPPSHTTVTAGCLRVVFGITDEGANEPTSPAAPAGYSNFISNYFGTGAEDCTVLVASKLAESAGAEDPAAFGGTVSDDNWAAYHFAMRPA